MNRFQTAIANLFKIPLPVEKQGRSYGIRKYAGASTNTTGVMDWHVGQTSADNEIWSSLRLLIARSRSLYQDDSNVQTAIDELVSLVVDAGINLQSKVRNAKGELNLKVNQEIEDKFNVWAWNREWCDVAGRLTFWQMQSVIQHAMMVDGGILVRLVNKRFGRSPLPFALELIEVDQLDDRLNFWRANNGNEIRMGIEVDKWRRPVAYWLLDSHPGDFYRSGQGSLQSRRVPASEILHVCNRQGWRPGQTRGVPQVHAGILKARNLLGLEENEVVKSRVQSCITAFIENEMPDFEPDLDEYGNVIKDLFPGAIEYLQPGQKLAPFVPSSPNPNLNDFVKHFQRSIAGLFGLSSHSVTRDLSDANYSSLREGKLNEWRRVNIYRDQLNEDFNSPIFHRWLDLAVQFNFAKLPSDYESKKEEKYYCDYWFGAPMPWVDPMKDMQSTQLEIELGLTTRSRVLAAVGIDFEEILQEKAKEKALMEQYGVDLEGAGDNPDTPPADGEDPGAPATLIEGMQAVREVAIAAIKSVSDLQVRTVEAVPVEVKDVAPVATEPEEPVEININLSDFLPPTEPEAVEEGEYYPLLPGMTRAVSIDGERKAKPKKQKKRCTSGQVCGFSCISKTKVCLADMTAKEFQEHNKAKRLEKAEKRKAAKAAGGAVNATNLILPMETPHQKNLLGIANGGGDSRDAEAIARQDKILREYNKADKLQKAKVERLKAEGLTQPEADAMAVWLDGYYQPINKSIFAPSELSTQRETDIGEGASVRGLQALQKLPAYKHEDFGGVEPSQLLDRGQLQRGINTAFSGMSVDDVLKPYNDNIGKEILEPTFFATTALKKFTMVDDANLIYLVTAKSDGTGQGRSVDKFKNEAVEGEVLFPPFSRFRVTKVENPKATARMLVEDLKSLPSADLKTLPKPVQKKIKSGEALAEDDLRRLRSIKKKSDLIKKFPDNAEFKQEMLDDIKSLGGQVFSDNVSGAVAKILDLPSVGPAKIYLEEL